LIAFAVNMPPSFLSTQVGSRNLTSITTAVTESKPKTTACCELAKQDTFGLFDDITDTMWKRIRQRTQSSSWYWDPKNPVNNVQDPGWWNAHNMIPNFACPHVEKLGGAGNEGTKFVCNPRRLVTEEKPSCLIYSVGCAGDFKFEDEIFKLHKKACEIHVFDPANWERKGDVENKNIHYHAWGFKSAYDTESKSVVWPKGRGGGFKTFSETLKELGHENRTIDIFKIDCEGCEWSTHRDWISIGFRQILVEMHGVPAPEGTPKARWYQKPMDIHNDYYKDYMDNGYALFNHDPNGELGLELSFIKLDKPFWETPSEEAW